MVCPIVQSCLRSPLRMVKGRQYEVLYPTSNGLHITLVGDPKFRHLTKPGDHPRCNLMGPGTPTARDCLRTPALTPIESGPTSPAHMGHGTQTG